jgi:hypothetical protein
MRRLQERQRRQQQRWFPSSATRSTMTRLHNKSQWHRGAHRQLHIITRAGKHRGFDCTIGADGWPTDPNHPVYRAEKLLGSAEKQPAPGKRDAPLGPSVPSE